METDNVFKCSFCNNTYKTFTNFNKHKAMCELIYDSNKSYIKHNELIYILKHFNKKIQTLENELERIKKYTKHVNIPEWLNETYYENITLDKWYTTIVESISEDDILYLYQHNYDVCIVQLIMRNISSSNVPLMSFEIKKNILFEHTEDGWIQMPEPHLQAFLSKLSISFIKYFNTWSKENKVDIMEKQIYGTDFNEVVIKKMMTLVDYKLVSKIKCQLYTYTKQNLQHLEMC